MISKLVEKWDMSGIMSDMTDEDKEILAKHLEEATIFSLSKDSTGMFLVGEEVSVEQGSIMLVVLTSRVYRKYKTPFDMEHLYESMTKSFNNFSPSMVEMAVMGIDVEMEFISIFSEIYDPKEKDFKIDPQKFVSKHKL